MESSYTWVKPKARLSKSPQQGLTRVSVSLLGSGVRAPFTERIAKRRKPREKEKREGTKDEREGKEQSSSTRARVGQMEVGLEGGREC